ncbi:gamma-glutamyltranspeptidase, partial [Marihabitans asiaticum]
MAEITRRTVLTAGGAGAAVALTAPPGHAEPAHRRPPGRGRGPRAVPEPLKVPEAIGAGGAVSCVDPYAADVGMRILRSGGNAVDAAVAMAATLGVTEPFSCGLGGGGFFVYHHARSGRTWTINGRETAPASFTSTSLTDGAGNALPFAKTVSSGLSVGVPGTPLTWQVALDRFGTRRLRWLLRPAEQLARRGFVVDAYYRRHTESNAERFRLFPETARVFLPGGKAPEVGDTMRNPDLADTYDLIGRRGVGELYRGQVARAIVDEVRDPSTAPGVSVYPGQLTAADLAAYTAPVLEPTRASHRGLD